VVLLAGCSFEPPGAGPTTAPDAAISADAASADVDAPSGQPPPPPPDAPPQVTCTTSDGALQLCLELEDASFTSGTVVDGSGHARDATVANLAMATRDVPTVSHAAGLSSTSAIRVAETSALDAQAVTLMAWVQRTSIPASGARFGVLDIGRRQAALAIDDSGHVVCFVKTDETIWFREGGSTGRNEWALAACTYDAPTLCAYSFRAGSATPDVTCGSTDGASLDTSSSSGTTIGALFDLDSGNLISHFAGNVDGIRIYNRALTRDELCRSGNIPGC